MAKGKKYYCVWEGLESGVYTSWEACEKAVKGFPSAKHMSFKSEEEAEDAYATGYKAWAESHKERKGTEGGKPVRTPSQLPPEVDKSGIAVDAACSGNPGQMEYRGVSLADGKEIFHFGPTLGTNNIGEFLAIVHAMALLKKLNMPNTIYSDSMTAQKWVRIKECKTTLVRNKKTEELYRIIARAEAWLHNNQVTNPVKKWQTDKWGEIPADFGRK